MAVRSTDAVSFRPVRFAPNRIAADLELLRRADPEGTLAFGASAHRYRLDPPLDDSEVAAFEARYAIVLPADYREFVLHVGNGGAGPYYGVFRLGEMDDVHGHAAWVAGTFVGDPSKPFPHTQPWNLSKDELEELQATDGDEEILRRYWVPVDGAIPLCHEGCALRDWLVVTGPEAGHVWHDATADFEGWRPVLDSQGARATFGAWYTDWLGAAVDELARRA